MVLRMGSYRFAGQQKKAPALLLFFICFSLVSFSHFIAAAATTPRVAAGAEHAVALKNDGTVWAWGSNAVGQLGTGGSTSSDQTTPAAVAAESGGTGGLSSVTAIAAGESHSIALKSTGTVLTWGDNTYGQLGTNSVSVGGYSATPVAVVAVASVVSTDPTFTNISSVSAGGNHSVALTGGGAVWVWGSNQYGQLGISINAGTTTANYIPNLVTINGSPIISAIAAGNDFTLVLDSNGAVWAWGNNRYGQLGNSTNIGTDTANATPVQVSSLTNVKAIAAGYDFGLALDASGNVWAWGHNKYGQLGNSTNIGTDTDNTVPVQVSGVSTASALSAGRYHSTALKSDGTVWSWGMDAYGQLGDGNSATSSTPVQASGFTGGTAVAAGDTFTVALKSNGTAWAWGDDSSGQLGNGSITTFSDPAVPTPGQVSSFNVSILLGDMNDSGKVTAADALLVLQYSVGINTLGLTAADALARGDVNNSLKVTAADALLILQKSVGIASY